MTKRLGGFWSEAFALRGSVTRLVVPEVAAFGGFAAAVCVVEWAAAKYFGVQVGLEVAPLEVAGAALGLLLVLRTNAGYDRWWEGRKLWGGIVNQSRNLAAGALAYGPADAGWRRDFVRWVAAFPHAARNSLRGLPPPPELAALVGSEAAARVAASPHAPSFVAFQLAGMLREACEKHGTDRFAFLQLDRERATLIDHVGACERILKTPLPRAYSIMVRRLLTLFLLTLPLALLHRLSVDWIVPLLTLFVAYPFLALDRIAEELQNPFSLRNLNRLPLEDICATIEGNVVGLLEYEQGKAGGPASVKP